MFPLAAFALLQQAVLLLRHTVAIDYDSDVKQMHTHCKSKTHISQ